MVSAALGYAEEFQFHKGWRKRNLSLKAFLDHIPSASAFASHAREGRYPHAVILQG